MKKLNFTLCLILLSLWSCQLLANEKQKSLAKFEQNIAKHQGKVIYIDFWASWCIPCRESFPWMQQMQNKYQEQGLKIITVNLDADKSNALTFLAEFNTSLEVVYDPKGYIAKQFKLKGMPNSFIVDRTGKVVARHAGFNQEKKVVFEREILNLLTD